MVLESRKDNDLWIALAIIEPSYYAVNRNYHGCLPVAATLHDLVSKRHQGWISSECHLNWELLFQDSSSYLLLAFEATRQLQVIAIQSIPHKYRTPRFN